MTPNPQLVYIKKKDPTIIERLYRQENQEALLIWMIEGAKEWFQTGLFIPQEVIQVTKDYNQNQDTIQQFIDERCVIGPDRKVKSSDLRDAFDQWCNKRIRMTPQMFKRDITSRGFEYYKNNVYYYRGISLQDNTYELLNI